MANKPIIFIFQMQADVLNVRSVFAVLSYEVVDSSLVERVSERTAQLSPVYNNLNLLSPDKVFTLSLEWSLFQPNSRCFVEKVSLNFLKR